MIGELKVVHLPERARYELRKDDQVLGFADAVPRGDCVLLPYVYIDPPLRGGNLGTELLHEALQDLRSKNLKVVPTCPFVVAFFKRHPEYAEMIHTNSAQLI